MGATMASAKKRLWYADLLEHHEELWSAVLLALELCEKARLAPGASGKPNLEDDEMVATYVMDCVETNVPAKVVREFMHEARRSWKWFPSSSAFAEFFSEKAEAKAMVLERPVYWAVDGHVFVGPEERAQALGVEYWKDSTIADRVALGLPAGPAVPALGTGKAESPAAMVAKVATAKTFKATDATAANPDATT